MTFIVGLHAPAGGGKDTVGGILKRDFGFQTVAYAETLKAMLATVGLPEPERWLKNEQCHPGAEAGELGRPDLEKMLSVCGWVKNSADQNLPGFEFSYSEAYAALRGEWRNKLWGMPRFSWRDAAQLLGTEWGRRLDPDIWVKITHQKVWAALREDPMTPWAITDVRFENEAGQIHRDGGFVLHIRGRAENMAEANVKHASENGVAFRRGDHAVLNDSDIPTLAQRVGAIMRGLPQ